MKKKILKFETPFEDDFSINLPKGAEILSVFLRTGTNLVVCICILATPDNEKEARHFNILANGHSLPDDDFDYKHIGSFPFYNAMLGFHVFEKISRISN